ncbi:MAG: HD domain-containing protein [Gemmatimonadales bacterium]|nr:HD domain-containing protein [Gemmatimonadales bacterium]
MFGNSTTGRTTGTPPDAVSEVMRHLRAAGGVPCLSDLDSGTIAAFRDFPHVQAVSVITEAEGAGLLDPARARSTQASVGEWTQNGESSLYHLSRTLKVKARPFITVRLGLDVDPDEAPEVVWALDSFTGVVEGVAEIWAEAVSARAEGRRVETENQALNQLNRLQGRFTAMTSHELKTPLTSITAYADVLRSLVPADQVPQASEFLTVIQTEAARLLRMVNRILDFSRIDSQDQLLKRVPERLEPLAHEVVRSLRPMILAKGLDCQVEIQSDLPKAMVDADLIRQVLVNLVGNAIKFTPEGGRIVLAVEESDASLCVRVADSGPGIPPDDIRRIFREFYRSSGPAAAQEGTGLGLTIAQRILHLHDGNIHVDRRLEGGSEFSFHLPKQMIFPVPLPEAYGARLVPGPALRLVRTLIQMLAELSGSKVVILMLRDGFGELIPVAANSLKSGDGYPAPFPVSGPWLDFLVGGTATRAVSLEKVDLPWNPLGPMGCGDLVFAPLGSGKEVAGCLVLGRRGGAETYSRDDLTQISVLAGLSTLALDGLRRWSSGPKSEESEPEVERITAALRGLLRIRRTGIPTATAPALRLVECLGRRCGLDEEGIEQLKHAAALHDAGMAHIEDEILLGETDLSWDERDEVDLHVEQGVELMEPLIPDPHLEKIIRHHHERMDGSGYPAGLTGQDIPLGSRLLSVVDAWFSLTRGRPYRPGLAPRKALAEIQENGGSQFDEQVISELGRVLASEGWLAGDSQETGN